MTAPNKPTRLYTLDAMRGLAAIVVVISHLPGEPVAGGYLAVDFFFALSGLVVSMAYQQRLLKDMTPSAFMLQRVLRLYPLYLVGLLFGIVVAIGKIALDMPGALGTAQLISGAVFGAAMLPSPVGWVPFPVNGPSWSLFLEMAINLAFCLVLVKFRTWALILVAVSAAVALVVLGLAEHDLNQGWKTSTLPGGVARVAFSFTVGMLIWRTIGSRPRTPTVWWLAPPLALVAVLLAPIPPDFHLAYGFVAIFVILPALVVTGALFAAPDAVRAGCQFLGDISYPLYIVHRPLLALGAVPTAFGIGAAIWAPLIVLALVAFAWILAARVDPFLRGRLRLILVRRKA